MEKITTIIITFLSTLIASSGFWAFVTTIADKKSAKSKMLLGLAHDRIISLGMSYITRGNITQAEYENLNKYLYEPYIRLGGNGFVKHMMDDVKKLPIAVDAYRTQGGQSK